MALNMIFTKPGISSLPCERCGCDTLHVKGVCNACDTRYVPAVIRVHVSGRDYHRIQSEKDWQRRLAQSGTGKHGELA